MPTFRVIRVSGDYGVILVVSPEYINRESVNAKYFLHHDNLSSGDGSFFSDASKETALGYFSGVADALDWGTLPQEPFQTLADIEAWASREQSAFYKRRSQTLPPDADLFKDFIALFAEETDLTFANQTLQRIMRHDTASPQATRLALEALARSPVARSDATLAQEIADALSTLPVKQEPLSSAK